jgi:uncharacterized repeat protein (TIGR04076 family)
MGLIVKEIISNCPVYKVGDSVILEGRYKINPKKSCTICMHSLASIIPYHIPLSGGISHKQIGLAKEGYNYPQNLDGAIRCM